MSDWQDPFADDDKARERAARRAEREARRREQQARDSVGDRVREEMAKEQAATPPPEPSPAPPSPPRRTVTPPVQEEPPEAAEPPAERPGPAEEPVAEEELAPSEEPGAGEEIALPVEPGAADPPPAQPPSATREEEPFWDDEPVEPLAAPSEGNAPPPRGRSSGAIRRRRAGALIALGFLIVVVAAMGVFLSRRGDEEAPATQPVKDRKTIEVVVPEGYDRAQIAEVAEKAGLKGDYLEATENVKGFDLEEFGAEGAQNLEGLLFPATYELFKGAKVETLVKKQLEAFRANLAETDIKAAENRGFTPYEVVTVASMVEREIAVPEERELAASVIYNRLDEGTPLGIDATIRFEDQNYSGQIVQSRLEEDTPYNTRLNSGLPPGPIGNPGLASLEAAANPADSDFFYFVVKPGSCNEHTFVETEAEFAAAEQAYQDALIAEGGSPTEC